MIRRFLIILPVFILFSCHYISQESVGKTRIRAVVVNPKKSEFYISKDFFQQNADTLHLSANNDVNMVLDNIEEGLYMLYLFPEYQTIYLKPYDSLAMHINIDEFDESLSFSGGLGFENNLLVDLFLINEKQSEQYFSHKHRISQKQLIKLIDSFTAIKQNLLQDYRKELSQTTGKFKKIVDLYMNSTTYSIKEDFAKTHKNLSFSKDYFTYRKILQKPVADEHIIDLLNFADIYLSSLVDDKNTPAYQQLLEVCQKEIADEKLKSVLLSRYCYGYITSGHIVKQDSIVKAYVESIKNKQKISFCKKNIEKNKRLQPGRAFPSIALKTAGGQVISSDSLFKNSKIIISVWDLYWQKNFDSNSKKFQQIHSKYPDIELVFLNKNYDDSSLWKQVITEESTFKYYQIIHKEDASLVMPYSFAQVYFLQNDTIKQSMLNLFQVDFDEYLNHFSKKKPIQ